MDDMYWDGPNATIETKHQRLVALRQLIEHGMPCILWGEDALAFGHSVPTQLSDQQILVRDDLLDAAAAVLEGGRYRKTTNLNANYPQREVAYAFPRSVRLQHLDIPKFDPYKFFPTPRNILLLPESYFALDARSDSRFLTLASSLDASNGSVLVPKYHTFLEGLVHCLMNPPSGHRDASRLHHIFINHLLYHRIKGRNHIKQEVYSEIQCEDCAWFMYIRLFRQCGVSIHEIEQYKHYKNLRQRHVFQNNDTSTKFRMGANLLQQRIREYSTHSTSQLQLDVQNYPAHRTGSPSLMSPMRNLSRSLLAVRRLMWL